jgi:hypothetical protein
MGLFGYSFIDLTDAQKHARRDSLDLHAATAQVSIGITLALIQIYFLGAWVSGRFGKSDEEGRPSSPYAKHEEEVSQGYLNARLKVGWRRCIWWMGEEVGTGLGRKGEWVLGGVWLSWLLVLCVSGTGEGEFYVSFLLLFTWWSWMPFFLPSLKVHLQCRSFVLAIHPFRGS